MTERRIVSSEQTNKYFLDWLAFRTNNEFQFTPDNARTIAYVETDDNQTFNDAGILVVTAYSHFTPFTCEVTIASSGAKKQKASREYIWHCFNYAFTHLNKLRIDAHIALDNYKSQTVIDMLGFKKQGTVKDQYGEGKDAYFYTLTKKEWQEGPWALLHRVDSINNKNNEGIN